jgi:hypothetical protein
MNHTKNNIEKTKIVGFVLFNILVISILFLARFVLFNLSFLYIVFSGVRVVQSYNTNPTKNNIEKTKILNNTNLNKNNIKKTKIEQHEPH